MFWSVMVWSLKFLVVLWALQLVVFALGISLMSKRPTVVKRAVAGKGNDEAITQRGLEPAAEKPAG